MHEATDIELNPLGTCCGERPWLGLKAAQHCNLPSRLLIRTASNSYFPQVVSVLSLPEHGTAVQDAVRSLWKFLEAVDDLNSLLVFKRLPEVTQKLASFSDNEVLNAIEDIKSGPDGERPVKQVELEAILAAPEGFGDDVPLDETSMRDAYRTGRGVAHPCQLESRPSFSFTGCAR